MLYSELSLSYFHSLQCLSSSLSPKLFQTCSTRHYKTGNKPLYQSWMRQPDRNKRVPSSYKVRELPLSLLGFPQNTKIYNHQGHAQDLAHIHKGSMFVPSASVTLYEPCLIESVNLVLSVSSISHSQEDHASLTEPFLLLSLPVSVDNSVTVL